MPCAYLIKLSLQHLMCPAFEPIILNAFLFLHHSHCRVYSWGSQLHALEKCNESVARVGEVCEYSGLWVDEVRCG